MYKDYLSGFVPQKSFLDPDKSGHYGIFGGRYVPETLMPILLELEESYQGIRFNKDFWSEVCQILREYCGRPSPLYFAPNLSKECGGRIYLKREDLNHTGSHKINNVIAQGLLAKKMGKHKVLAETGAGQHGVATATMAALLGLECEIFMGEKDVKRQALNVFRMKLLGARVHSVSSGSKTLKDAMNEAIRAWVSQARDSFYVLGTVGGPYPYPMMVKDFQSVISYEAKTQFLHKEKKLPDFIIACIGGGSNAMGSFAYFLDEESRQITQCIGVEAGGMGLDTNFHGASLAKGRHGVLHGQSSYYLQDGDGQILEAHSISAGLDYPGIGAEHAYLFENNLAHYDWVTDSEALDAFVWLSKLEGIIPAFESAHAIAYLKKHKNRFNGKTAIITISGRGDKDVAQAMEMLSL